MWLPTMCSLTDLCHVAYLIFHSSANHMHSIFPKQLTFIFTQNNVFVSPSGYFRKASKLLKSCLKLELNAPKSSLCKSAAVECSDSHSM